MKIVSVIVPVYNSENYLKKCLDSLIHQTLSDIEVILIDDASTDYSAHIMKEYEENYPDMVRCIYLQQNIKQGGARNRGLEIASGDFITFVDSDDEVDVTLCEKLYNKAIETESDLVFCDHYTIFEDTGKIRYNSTIYKEQTGIVDQAIRKSLFFQKHHIVVKLIKRSLIIDNEIYFPENRFYEDIAVVLLYSLYAKKIEKVYEPLYKYRIHVGSTVQSSNNQSQIQEAVLILLDRLKERGFMKEYQQEIEMVFIYDYYLFPLQKALMLFDEPLVEHIKYITEEMRRLCPNYQNNPYLIKYTEPYYLEIARLNDQSTDRLLDEYQKGSLKESNYGYKEYYSSLITKVNEVISYCKSKNYTTALWGAGLKGQDFLQIADPDKIIRYVIDKNKKLHNRTLETGHPICALETVSEIVDFIIVANINYYQEIVNEVTRLNNKIIVFNLDLFIRTDIPFERFLK